MVKLRALLARRTTGTGAVRSPTPARSLGPVLVLTVALALGAAAVLLALVMLLVEPEPIEGLGTSQRQDAESAVYLLTFGAILPLALLAGPRVARRIESGPNASALSALVAILACALAGAVLVVRIAVELDVTSLSRVLLAVGALWWLLAAGLLQRARSERPLPGGPALERAQGALWTALAVLVFLCALAVTRRDEIAAWPFVLGLLAAVPLTIALARRRPRRLAGGLGRALDAGAIALILLAVPDLVVIEPDAAGATALMRFLDGVVQFHHDFLLGPANQVLGGDAVLVDTASQYGVGSIWFLAGWFQLFPIGYGTFGLLDGLLTALFFAAGFGVMRLAGVSRLLASVAIALGVAVLVYARVFPVGAIPQEGPLRFGLPLLVILAVVAGARLGRRGLGQGVALTALGLASVWSIESFGMTGVTLAALVCAESGPASRRRASGAPEALDPARADRLRLRTRAARPVDARRRGRASRLGPVPGVPARLPRRRPRQPDLRLRALLAGARGRGRLPRGSGGRRAVRA